MPTLKMKEEGVLKLLEESSPTSPSPPLHPTPAPHPHPTPVHPPPPPPHSVDPCLYMFGRKLCQFKGPLFTCNFKASKLHSCTMLQV